jgi:hypothetical protein
MEVLLAYTGHYDEMQVNLRLILRLIAVVARPKAVAISGFLAVFARSAATWRSPPYDVTEV